MGAGDAEKKAISSSFCGPLVTLFPTLLGAKPHGMNSAGPWFFSLELSLLACGLVGRSNGSTQAGLLGTHKPHAVMQAEKVVERELLFLLWLCLAKHTD